jgi:hypothetical protein
MNKRTLGLLAVLAVILTLSVAAILRRADTLASPVARISQDGALVREIALDQVSARFSFDVFTQDGHSNTVSVDRGRICVSHADCPDLICVAQGWITDSATPIVCLPHKLMIDITGGGSGLDAVTG